MNRPVVVNVPLSPIHVLIRIFVRIFDAIHLVAQAIGLVEKDGRARAHHLKMLSVAGQEILPTRNVCHGHLTRSSPGAALSAMLPLECAGLKPENPTDTPARTRAPWSTQGYSANHYRNPKMSLI